MSSSDAHPRRSRRVPVGHVGRLLAAVCLATLLGPLDAVRAEDQEPLPPPVFFWQPDAETASEIAELLGSLFADRSKAPRARDRFVKRYKQVAIPQLVNEVQSSVSGRSSNQPVIWNSMLTLGAMRDRLGASPHLWPALEPLTRSLAMSEVWQRTFAALALGCWHWAEADRPVSEKGGEDVVPGRVRRMKRHLDDARRRLGDAAADYNAHVRIAAMLALAKHGGSQAWRALEGALKQDQGANPEGTWAALLAQAFLRERKGAAYLAALATDDRGLKRAAGLAISVGALQEGAAELPWLERPEKVCQALSRTDLHAFDGPELVFARGVLTWKLQRTDGWRQLFDIAVNPRMDSDIAVAAVQSLLFCEEPWFKREMVSWARGESGRTLAEPVLAGFLLRAASQGSPGGIEAAARYLTQPARRPKGTRAFDVRFHAAVGIARAFAAGALKAPEVRAKALAALRGGLRSMHKEAPFRAALARWVEAHAHDIETQPHWRPELADVRLLEAAFAAPNALLARDLVDVCVHRVNKMTLRLFGAHNVQPPSGDSPEKANTSLLFLRSYLEAYPYFSRLEFQWRRGVRDLPTLPAETPGVIDR